MATIQAQGKTPSDDELRTYIQALKQDPKSRIFAPLARGLLARGRIKQASQVCQAGVRANPEFADGYIIMAQVFLAQARPEDAARFVQRAKELAPDRAMVYAVAGQVLMELGQAEVGCDSCLKALDLDPECELALDLLGRYGGGPLSAEGGGPKPLPKSGGTRPDIKKRSQTAPSSRRRDGKPAQQISEPFRKILPALGTEGSDRLDDAEQPFTALSSGSQSGAAAEAHSSLPARPEPPPPADTTEPRAVSRHDSLKTVAVAQAIIDSYGPSPAYEPSRRIPKPRPPWSGRLLAIASVIALLVGIVAMLFAIMPSHKPLPAGTPKKAPRLAPEAPPENAPQAQAPAAEAPAEDKASEGPVAEPLDDELPDEKGEARDAD